jgi:hypothetical protein
MTHRHESYSTPLHRKDAMVWTNRAELRERLRKTPRCPHCRKRIFRTKTDARSFLALIISYRDRQEQADDYQLRPYACPYGNGWHFGHDRTVAKLLEEARKK